jgi:hypothetical protein
MTGRETVYHDVLPVGEVLTYQLEPNPPPPWSTGTTQADWLREQGTVLRLAVLAEHGDLGSWRLPFEIDVGDAHGEVDADVP